MSIRRAQEAYEDRSLWSGSKLALDPGEYAGPLVVDRTCQIEGNGATIVGSQGPVMRIAAPNVRVRGLRVELAGSDGVAIEAAGPGARLQDVCVRGDLVGVSGEEPGWSIPSIIRLGDFAAGARNSFSVRLDAPMDARVKSRIRGVSVSPDTLRRGENAMRIEVDPLADNTMLYGEIIVQTGVARRIWVSGKAVEGAPKKQACADESPGPARSRNDVVPPAGTPRPPRPGSVRSANRKSPSAGGSAAPSGSGARTPGHAQRAAPGTEGSAPSRSLPGPRAGARLLMRGERIELPDPLPKNIQVLYHGVLGAAPYVFLLDQNRRSPGEQDVIQPGNHATHNGSVTAGTSGGRPLVIIHPRRLPPEVDRVRVCFSVPPTSPTGALPPGARVEADLDGKPWCDIVPDQAGSGTAFVAMELYRHKGAWRLMAVGACPKGGLETVYEEAGLPFGQQGR